MPATIELPEDATAAFELPVLSIRALVSEGESERFIAEALRDVRVFMQAHHISATGPPFAICRPDGDDVDIEAGWPTGTKTLASTSRIHSGSLPRSLTGPQARRIN